MLDYVITTEGNFSVYRKRKFDFSTEIFFLHYTMPNEFGPLTARKCIVVLLSVTKDRTRPQKATKNHKGPDKLEFDLLKGQYDIH